MSFPFERLEVYKRSLLLVDKFEVLHQSLKGKVSYPLLDQLNRAILSIPLNIAEGNGRWHNKEKKNFFWIAQGSVFEVVPLIQILWRKGLIAEENYRVWYKELEIVGKMMTNLVRSVENLQK